MWDPAPPRCSWGWGWGCRETAALQSRLFVPLLASSAPRDIPGPSPSQGLQLSPSVRAWLEALAAPWGPGAPQSWLGGLFTPGVPL